jgi:hypothetical protein
MPAALHRLRTRPARLREEQAQALRQLILGFPALPQQATTTIIAAIDRETAAENGWSFVMLSPAQNFAVVQWLMQHSKRPREAVLVWALLFDNLRRDTGEIVLSRDEIADRLGIHPTNVSRIMSELESIEAVSSRRDPVRGVRGPGMVRWYMNPNVATHLGGKARERAQADAALLDLAPPAKPTRRPKLAPVD